MAHRAMLMGWSRDQQGAARVVISDNGAGGGEPRRLELQFVLPGGRIADMERLDHTPPSWSPSSPSSSSLPSSSSPSSRTIDLKANPPSSGVPLVQPSAWKKTGGGFASDGLLNKPDPIVGRSLPFVFDSFTLDGAVDFDTSKGDRLVIRPDARQVRSAYPLYGGIQDYP
jgi:hypothetical protein